MRIPPFAWVNELAVNRHAEVKVIPAGKAGHTGETDNFPAFDGLFGLDLDAAHVGVEARESLAMIDDDGVAVDSEQPGETDNPAVCGFDRGMNERCEIDPDVKTFPHRFSTVKIGPAVTKERHRGGVLHPDKGILPELSGLRFHADGLDGFEIGGAQHGVYVNEGFDQCFPP